MRFRMLAAVTSLMLSLVVAVPSIAQESVAVDSSITVGSPRRPAILMSQPRTGWMLGFGGGYGLAGPKVPTESPDREAGGTFHARLGSGVSRSALVGIEYLTWGATPTDSTSWAVVAAGPSVTWYWRSNLYVRGMVGWAMGKAEFETGTAPATSLVSIHDDGFAFLGAVGWEFRYRRRLAIAPEVQYLRLGLASRTTYDVMSGALSLNWYY